MVQPTTEPKNGFVRVARKVYNPLGFSKGYNFTLFFIFAGALFGFTLSRLKFLSFDGGLCDGTPNGANPGECYYFRTWDRYRIGIMVHLGTILPAGLLVVFQFVPAIRHKFILYHRMAGYVIFLLLLVSNGGALAIADRSFGGSLDIQAYIGILALASTIFFILALVNVKRLQIEQHRAWMLRVWFWVSSIITLRIIMIIAANIMPAYPMEHYQVFSCDKLEFIYKGDGEKMIADYPMCDPLNSNVTIDEQVIVRANFGGGKVPEIVAALNAAFGMAGWLALLLHAVGVEIYLYLTPKEKERLRQVSYQRQLERGFMNPGSAGLVAQRLGDADPWEPAEKSQEAGMVSDVNEK